MHLEAPLKSDGEGFTSQETPCCNELFKVAFGKGSEDPLAYCPYCGAHTQCWTVQQKKYLDLVAEVNDPEQASGLPMPHERERNWAKFTFSKCHPKDAILYVGLPEKLFCIMCGTEHDVKGPDVNTNRPDVKKKETKKTRS